MKTAHRFLRRAGGSAGKLLKNLVVGFRKNRFVAQEAFHKIHRQILSEFLPGKPEPRLERARLGTPAAKKSGYRVSMFPQPGSGNPPAKNHVGAETAGFQGIRSLQGKAATSRFRNVLIVGGMDFLGAALVHQLNATGFREITVTDKLEEETCRKIAPLKFREFLSQEEYDEISKFRFRPFQEYSHIFYLGGWRAGKLGEIKNLLAASAKGSTRFITVSSAASLGPCQLCLVQERHDPENFRPLTEAGLVAALFDRHALSKAGNSYLSLKHHSLFGPGEREGRSLEGIVKSCYRQIRSSGSIHLPAALRPDAPEGRRRFDFFPVLDAARLALFLSQSPSTEGVYELGSGISATAGELANAVIDATGCNREIVWDEELQYDPPSPQPDRSWLGRLEDAGWQSPFFSLGEAVKHYIATYLEPGIDLGDEPCARSRVSAAEIPESRGIIPEKRKTENSMRR